MCECPKVMDKINDAWDRDIISNKLGLFDIRLECHALKRQVSKTRERSTVNGQMDMHVDPAQTRGSIGALKQRA
jgi:hypothetical protein